METAAASYYGPNQSLVDERIIRNDRLLGGRPIIRDTGIPVEVILAMFIYGARENEILNEYCELEPLDLNACIAYACGKS